jgi:hypothetical protein
MTFTVVVVELPADEARVVVVTPGAEAFDDLSITKVAPTKRTRMMNTTISEG